MKTNRPPLSLIIRVEDEGKASNIFYTAHDWKDTGAYIERVMGQCSDDVRMTIDVIKLTDHGLKGGG